MRRVFGGAILVIAGIAAFIEAHSHKRACRVVEEVKHGEEFCAPHSGVTGLSQTAYDLLHIGA